MGGELGVVRTHPFVRRWRNRSSGSRGCGKSPMRCKSYRQELLGFPRARDRGLVGLVSIFESGYVQVYLASGTRPRSYDFCAPEWPAWARRFTPLRSSPGRCGTARGRPLKTPEALSWCYNMHLYRVRPASTSSGNYPVALGLNSQGYRRDRMRYNTS